MVYRIAAGLFFLFTSLELFGTSVPRTLTLVAALIAGIALLFSF